MAGSGTFADKGFTVRTRRPRGETLADVDEDRKRNGLTDPNDRSTRFHAATDVTIKKEALPLLEKEAVKRFGRGEIKKRVNAVMKKRDSVDGHGAIKLKHSIV